LRRIIGRDAEPQSSAAFRALPQRNALGIEDEDALHRVDAAIDDGKAIGITHDDDLVRLASLAFLPEPLRSDPRTVRIITRVLSRQDWEPMQRLDFIETFVI
jgi:hypothetical protein